MLSVFDWVQIVMNEGVCKWLNELFTVLLCDECDVWMIVWLGLII